MWQSFHWVIESPPQINGKATQWRSAWPPDMSHTEVRNSSVCAPGLGRPRFVSPLSLGLFNLRNCDCEMLHCHSSSQDRVLLSKEKCRIDWTNWLPWVVWLTPIVLFTADRPPVKLWSQKYNSFLLHSAPCQIIMWRRKRFFVVQAVSRPRNHPSLWSQEAPMQWLMESETTLFQQGREQTSRPRDCAQWVGVGSHSRQQRGWRGQRDSGNSKFTCNWSLYCPSMQCFWPQALDIDLTKSFKLRNSLLTLCDLLFGRSFVAFTTWKYRSTDNQSEHRLQSQKKSCHLHSCFWKHFSECEFRIHNFEGHDVFFFFWSFESFECSEVPAVVSRNFPAKEGNSETPTQTT